MPDLDVTSNMCLPVHPETEHPEGRPSLIANKPLPWANCYHTSCWMIPVFLSRAVRKKDFSSAYTLNKASRALMSCVVDMDSKERQTARTAARRITTESQEECSDVDTTSLGDCFSDDASNASGGIPGRPDNMQLLHEEWAILQSGSDSEEDTSTSSVDSSMVQHDLLESDSLTSVFEDQCLWDHARHKEHQEEAKETGLDKIVIPAIRYSLDIARYQSLHSAVELDEDYKRLRR